MEPENAAAGLPPLAASQATTHFPMDPVTADMLFDRESARRDGLVARGRLGMGSHEIDEEVLLGGFERGSIVGVSAEKEEFGLLVGLQTVAQMLVTASSSLSRPSPRAMIITTLAANLLLPVLKEVLLAQFRVTGLSEGDASNEKAIKQCLEAISIARVFDFEGLTEVLRELDVADPGSKRQAESPKSSGQSNPVQDIGNDRKRPRHTEQVPVKVSLEIQDSEDEESEVSSQHSPTDVSGTDPGQAQQMDPAAARSSSNLDVILITHSSSIFSSLFARRDGQSAHTLVQVLSSQLRYLSRASEHGGPLIMLLNSTNPADSSGPGADGELPQDGSPGHPGHNSRQARKQARPLEPTLRSIFTPSAPPTSYRYAFKPATRRTKPAFGMVFAQLLDLHLLCTLVLRTRADAAMTYAETMPSSLHTTTPVARRQGAAINYVWVVEVLLDEMGVWGTGGPGEPRRSREQRWGAVDIDQGNQGRRVVDAFTSIERKDTGPTRLAAGFGGPKV